MKNQSVAVIGANGKTGSRVLARLQAAGYATRALSRSSQFTFDWENRDTWVPALQGAHAVYVTYYPDLAVPRAEEDIRALVGAAKEAGIEHLVLLSGRGEDGAQRAEAVIKHSGMAWNIVRASWFMQNFSESFMLEGIQSGNLTLPEPKACEPFIDIDDLAGVVVAALTRPELVNQLFEVTGPELLTFRQCVDIIAHQTGRKIAITTVPVEAYLEGARKAGLPEDIAWLMNELFVNVLDGRNESVTLTLGNLLGRPPRRFEDYVANTAATGIWNMITVDTEAS